MGAPGEIRYARAVDGIDIAYTVWGEGPIDMVWAWSRPSPHPTGCSPPCSSPTSSAPPSA